MVFLRPVDIKVIYPNTSRIVNLRLGSSGALEVRGVMNMIWRHLSQNDTSVQIVIGDRSMFVMDGRSLQGDLSVFNFIVDNSEEMASRSSPVITTTEQSTEYVSWDDVDDSTDASGMDDVAPISTFNWPVQL